MKRGEFYYFFSTMGGGKSLELILDEFRTRRRGGATAIVKPARDKKAGRNIETRFGQTRIQVDTLLSHDPKTANIELSNVISKLKPTNKPITLYLDEVQFLTRDHINDLRRLIDQESITVKAYGLLTDFTGTLFEASRAMIEIADLKTQIPSHCEDELCGNIAVYNARIIGGQVATSGPTIAIDGIDAEYKALCSIHYLSHAK